ncbi:MAG TPA: hypothetical protein VK419_02420 [Bryobacteraceae bacterium]|nr:hypothetical protein [Bryobacteraceae bacterium]
MIWLMILTLAMDLNAIRNEPNPGRRSELALQYADSAMDNARDANAAGDVEKTKAALEQVGEAVDLAYQSLIGSGKDARRDTKHLKQAELKTRGLLRRLDGLSQLMDVTDRPAADKIHSEVSKVHDELLQGIFSKKKSQ